MARKPRKPTPPRTTHKNTNIRTHPLTEWNPETVERVFELLCEGNSLRKISTMAMMPSERTLRKWEREDDETGLRFARGREIGTHAMGEECLDIADEEAKGMTHVQDKRLRIDTRLRLMGMWNRKMYGEGKFQDHGEQTPEDPLMIAAAAASEQEAIENLNDLESRLVAMQKGVRRPKLDVIDAKPGKEKRA